MAAAKPNLHGEVTKITTCSICHEIFKHPKSLPCVHTFCLHCLQGHCEDKLPGDDVTCPLCRREFQIPDKGLKDLPLNFFVQNLIDAKEASSDRPGDIPCEVCGDDDEDPKLATTYCVDCDQKLCDTCSRPHKKMKGGEHQVIPLGVEVEVELIRQRGSYCSEHKQKVLELYCFDCKSNICLVCSAVDHRNHKHGALEKVAQQFMSQIDAGTKPISSRIDEFSAAMIQVNKEREAFFLKCKEVEKEIDQRRQKVKQVADDQAEDRIREMGAIKYEAEKEVATHKEELEFGLRIMESFNAYCLELKKKGRPCDITRAADDLHTRAEELFETYQTPSQFSAPCVTFLPMNLDEPVRKEPGFIGRIQSWFCAVLLEI